MATATAEAIRDRIIALIEAFTPTSLSADKFRAYRNEGSASFTDDMEANPPGAFRRFQVREVGDDEGPTVSDTETERVILNLDLTIAYPQTQRYGAKAAMDRDDVMNQDWKQINAAIGIYGRANFSSTHDCTPLGAVKTREQSGNVDFLVVRARFEYLRSIT